MVKSQRVESSEIFIPQGFWLLKPISVFNLVQEKEVTSSSELLMEGYSFRFSNNKMDTKSIVSFLSVVTG
jgi:hypothetical protein